jgi:hypothetical protein
MEQRNTATAATSPSISLAVTTFPPEVWTHTTCRFKILESQDDTRYFWISRLCGGVRTI